MPCFLSYFQLATRVCPAKPSRRNPKSTRASHAISTAATNASCNVVPDCYAGNNSSFPVVHGIATAVEHSAHDQPHDPTITALKRNLQLDVNWRSHAADPLATQAPLASPEPLSETSSLASYGSGSFHRQLSGDRRWVCRQAVRMDPIRQSPLCRPSPPGTRLILSSVPSGGGGVAMGLCFPVEEMQHVDKSVSDHNSTACSVTQAVSAAAQLGSMCQTVVEVHHHQDSPLQNEASKSISDFVSEQTDDNISAELLSVDTPSAQHVSSAVSVDGHQPLHDTCADDCSFADKHCSHAATECSSNCKCSRTTDVSDSQKVDGDGQLCHLPQPLSTECQSHVECDTSESVSVVDTELDR